jgi:hypothetical protein
MAALASIAIAIAIAIASQHNGGTHRAGDGYRCNDAAGRSPQVERRGRFDATETRVALGRDGRTRVRTSFLPASGTASVFTALSPPAPAWLTGYLLVLSSDRPCHPLIFISDKKKNPTTDSK